MVFAVPLCLRSGRRSVPNPVVPIFCAFLAKNTTRFCAFVAHFGEGRDSIDDFSETMISLVDLIVILAVLVFCGGGVLSRFCEIWPDFAFRPKPILSFAFNLKPPRLEAKRSADVRSAEGACGASLSCASGAAKRNCASQGQTCPAEQCHELPPRVGASS